MLLLESLQKHATTRLKLKNVPRSFAAAGEFSTDPTPSLMMPPSSSSSEETCPEPDGSACCYWNGYGSSATTRLKLTADAASIASSASAFASSHLLIIWLDRALKVRTACLRGTRWAVDLRLGGLIVPNIIRTEPPGLQRGKSSIS